MAAAPLKVMSTMALTEAWRALKPKFEARGHKLRFVNSQGEVAAIMLDGGWLQGAADARRFGRAAGY